MLFQQYILYTPNISAPNLQDIVVIILETFVACRTFICVC